MRLAQLSLGDILLVDVLKGLALGKALDLEDARGTLRLDYNVKGRTIYLPLLILILW